MNTKQDERPAQKQDKTASKKNFLVPLALILAGLLVLLYPVVATQLNNFNQKRAAEAYSALEEETPPEQLNADLERAHQYNADHNTGPILDPWLGRIAEDNAEYQAYLGQLNAHDAMGRIIVPAAKADLPIYHGTSKKTLMKGAGHLFGSDLPVGGEGTHAVITAHTGMTNATLFDNLKEVKEGDAFYIAVAGEKLKYQVDAINVVLPEQTELLAKQEGRDIVTLVTCTPYGINTHRLLVTGHRVPMDPEEESVFRQTGLNWQWWMWAILAAVAVVLIGLLLWLRKVLAAKKNNDDEKDNVDEAGATDDTDGSETQS